MSEGQGEDLVREAGYRIVADMFFGEKEVARFFALEQAKW